jgi:hypothetical protein
VRSGQSAPRNSRARSCKASPRGKLRRQASTSSRYRGIERSGAQAIDERRSLFLAQ